MSGELGTAQVADYLGVKVKTVYAYVSRGVLTPVRRDREHGSIFALAEVQRLAVRGRQARRGPGTSEDVRTAITRIDGDRLFYRGHDVADLAGAATFEEVCALLWQRPQPSYALADGERRDLERLLAALPPDPSVLDRCKHAVLLAGAGDPGRHDLVEESVLQAGSRCLATMPAALPGARPGPRVVDTLLGHLPGADPGDLEVALVLLADHDLAVSTTALRVAVSARADAYSAFLAALAAADSPLHMRAPSVAYRWLRAAVEDPRGALADALQGRGHRPPGFGHLVYAEQDPRARILIDRLRPRCSPALRSALDQLIDELGERRGWPATVDLALAAFALVDDLPPQAGTAIFACARAAGWTAHAVEELAEPGMRFRLSGVYTGAR